MQRIAARHVRSEQERGLVLGATFALLMLAAILLSACNTVEGAGEDMSAAGHAVSKTANDVKN